MYSEGELKTSQKSKNSGPECNSKVSRRGVILNRDGDSDSVLSQESQNLYSAIKTLKGKGSYSRPKGRGWLWWRDTC